MATIQSTEETIQYGCSENILLEVSLHVVKVPTMSTNVQGESLETGTQYKTSSKFVDIKKVSINVPNKITKN